MSFLGNIFPFVGDSINEVFSHPLQAAGAALGVPGYDPFFGGLFNNKPGGALISPTGNFTSSAWQDMYKNNPGDAGALNQFSGINSIADKVAPMIAGYYAAPGIGNLLGGGAAGAASAAGTGAADAGSVGAAGLGGAGMGTAAGAADAGTTGLGLGTSGLGGMGMGTGATWGGAAVSPVVGSGTAGLFSSGAGAGGMTGLLNGSAALGDAGLSSAVGGAGSGMGMMGGVDMGSALGSAPTGLFSGVLPGGGMSGTASGALGGGLSGQVAGAAPIGQASMGGLLNGASGSVNPQQMMQQGLKTLNQSTQQQQQQQQQQRFPQQVRFGGQRNPQEPLGPSMSYASFNGAAPMNNNFFGIGSAYGTL